MGKVGFYIYHGVEVRYFLLSGLVDEIREDNEVYLYIHQEPSKILEDYAREYKVQLKLIPLEIGETPKFEGYLRAFTNSRKRINDVSIYSHFGYRATSKFYDALFKTSFVSLLGNRLFRFLAKVYYKDRPLMNFLKSEGLSRIYLLQYDSIHLKKIGVNAALSGIESYVFINTLKTLFIDDFVAFPIKKLFSWNAFQNSLFQRANMGFDENSFVAKGSPYHTFLLKRDNDYQAALIKKYGLDVEKPILLYSLINEKVFEREHLIIEKIINYLEDTFKECDRPQLIIRRNPFEQKTEHIEFLIKFNNIIIADHFWERDEKRSWSIQEEKGESEWRALLQLASASMNIPSMATIDSIVCGTPVITIGFDEGGDYNYQLDYLIDSPFNREFNKSEFVVECNSLSDFRRNFENAIQLKSYNSQIEIRNSLDIAVNEINQFL